MIVSIYSLYRYYKNINTWNLSLGLSNKKDIVTDYLDAYNIKVCCLQETEIPVGYPENILNCGGYNLELEQNTVKNRVGIYLHRDINYVRRLDLEKENLHVVFVDLKMKTNIRIISIFRPFRPQDCSPNDFFKLQLSLLNDAMTKNCLLMGDFNLDAGMEFRNDYIYKNPFSLLSDFTLLNNLVQLVNFVTWSRSVNAVIKESTLDHIYTDNDSLVNEVTFKVPTFGDHKLIIAKLNISLNNNAVSICKRSWHNYSKSRLLHSLVLSPCM